MNLNQKPSVATVKALEQALQDNPWDVTALVELGWLSFKLNNLKEAEQRLRRAVSLDRRNPWALESLAKVLIALEEFEEATSILEHLLLLRPEDSSLEALLEICYHRMGREQKVLESYRNRHDLRGGTSLVETPNKEVKPIARTAAKRILVINNLYPPQELGGYGRRVCDFANVLRERGHTIQVLTSDAPYLGEVKSLEDDVERSLLLCGTYEKLPPQYLTDSFKLTQILHHNDRVLRAKINNYAPDACLVGNIDLLTHTLFEPLLQNKIPVVHLLGFAQTGYTVPDAPTSPLYHIAANSEFGRQSILSQGYPFEDIGIVYPGAFIDQFQMCTLPNLERLRIVFAGLVMPYKGPQTLVEALSILHDADVDFHFQCAIAGASPLEGFIDELRAFVEAKGLENQVEFLGYLQRPQLIELFATHNVLVFPSVWEEPFGRSQVEAMAAGLTLITSGTGGSGEVIEPGVSGLTFPAGNAAALAEALMSLPKNRQRWESIATAGQKRAELFSIERSVDSIEEKFDELLKRRDNEGEFEHQKLQADLQNRLQLREINIVIFPDWPHAEESLSLEIAQVIKVIANHPDKSHITLLIDTSTIADEEAELAVSGIVMNLLMEEDLDVADGPELSLIGQLSQGQWSALLPCLDARLVLNYENQQVVNQVNATNLPVCKLDSLSIKRFLQ